MGAPAFDEDEDRIFLKCGTNPHLALAGCWQTSATGSWLGLGKPWPASPFSFSCCLSDSDSCKSLPMAVACRMSLEHLLCAFPPHAFFLFLVFESLICVAASSSFSSKIQCLVVSSHYAIPKTFSYPLLVSSSSCRFVFVLSLFDNSQQNLRFRPRSRGRSISGRCDQIIPL